VLPATSGADQIGRLRATRAALGTQERAALLQLFSLRTGVDRARGRLTTVRQRLAGARHDRDTARRQLRAARRTLAVADARLAAQLRAIYMYDRPDVVSVLFGATSLDDVLSGLDSVNRTAASTHSLIVQTRRARARVGRRLHSLTRLTARLSRLQEAATAAGAAIAGREAEQAAYIAGLHTRQRLTAQQIAHLEHRVRAAEAASTMVTVQAHAAKSLLAPPVTQPAPPPPTATTVTPPRPASGSGKRLTVVATAYSTHGGTASGLPTGPGVVAVDPTVIPLGTRMDITGYGPGIAADTGTAIKGLRIDLWFPTLKQALNWGKRTVTITLR